VVPSNSTAYTSVTTGLLPSPFAIAKNLPSRKLFDRLLAESDRAIVPLKKFFFQQVDFVVIRTVQRLAQQTRARWNALTGTTAT
jgi:hypothetical protein